jgi:hypothetical protein
MPLWLTTFVVGIVIVVWLLELRPRRGKTEEAPAEQDTASWLASDWRLRTLLLAGVISVTAVCWEVTPPVTFDRAEVHGRSGEAVGVAYVGTRGDKTRFAMCEADGVHSEGSVAMSTPTSEIAGLRLQDGGYRFHPSAVHTALSGVLSLFGMPWPAIGFDPIRPHLQGPMSDDTPVSERPVADLCGDGDMSVDDAAERLRTLTRAPGASVP